MLFLLALMVRGLAVSLVGFAPNEGSAYYVGVAGHLVAGDGLLSDAVWSYATPPLAAPKPAFELWQPMASLLAALPMAILGASYDAAQLSSAVVGALVAPLTWAVAAEAATASHLDDRRLRAVAIAAGLIAAVLAPFLVAAAGPDSTTPFLVFGTLAALLSAPLIRTASEAAPGGRAMVGRGLLLGAVLGLAWLSRQEAIWLAVAIVLVLIRELRRRESGRIAAATGVLAPIVLGGLAVVVPWLLRESTAFGSPFPGQAVENLWLRHNEDIFAFAERPTAGTYLAQGLSVIAGDRLAALAHQLVAVLLVPAFPIGLAGLVALPGLRRSPALLRPTALVVLLVSGLLTFVATALLFPVATLWGTFLHASGPLLVGLIVAATLGGDLVMARISQARRWGRVNIVVAPVALLAVAVPLAGLQLSTVRRQSDEVTARMAAVGHELAEHLSAEGAGPVATPPAVLMSDHPMWLATVMEMPVIALPDEAPAEVGRLAERFGATWLVVFDERGRYPEALLTRPRPDCLAVDPERLAEGEGGAWLFRLDPACRRP